jgi:hypothetical protein
MAWNAKIRPHHRCDRSVIQPDDDPASSPDHLHHFTRRSTRRDDVLDDKYVFARLEVENRAAASSAPSLRSVKKRPNPERPRDLVRDNHSTKRRRHVPDRSARSDHHPAHRPPARTELLGHRRMLQHQRTLQIS